MKEIQYKRFSWNTHKKNWSLKRPNVCQFELTFKCGLRCKHCYTDCYNKADFIKNELDTKEVKSILDKVYKAGVIWLCFTGGDPLSREDFLELYSYAKNKGFIVTIFTNGYSMTKRIADYLKKNPPFVIELTLNGVTREAYERISGVRGSFEKTRKGLNLILERKLPLKIKTQVTKDNLEELPKIKEFIENLGLNFRPSAFLHARLDGNLTPCSLRIPPQEVLSLDGKKKRLVDDDCGLSLHATRSTLHAHLFRCAIGGGDGVNIDPYGNLIPCNCIREPKESLFKESIEKANKIILNWVRNRTSTTNSKCKGCLIKDLCYNCPGKAWLEEGDLEEPVEWFCQLAHLAVKDANPVRNYSKLDKISISNGANLTRINANRNSPTMRIS